MKGSDWRCEHAMFCVDLFFIFMPYINVHLFIDWLG